ncbi:MAG: enoyl-CoA hydratase-related protein [Pseudomonadota bacterium]
MNTLFLHIDGAVARLMIDNPRRRNALTRAMWREIPPLVAQAERQSGVRALVLQSAAPGCFASGADISEFKATHTDPAESARATQEVHDAVGALADCELPTLALIDGPCVGGGVALALGCDIRLASQRASFAITPARLGLSYHPDDIARLVGACGAAAAAELLFGGQPVTAERAVAIGLVNRVHAEDAFGASTQALVDAICANSADAMRALKLGIAAARQPALHEQARQRFAELFEGRDFAEGRDAFLAKRPAQFPSHR